MKNFFLYNIKQADFFIKNDLCPVGCGIGNKNDVYIEFERNDEANAIQEKWLSLKYENSPRPSNK